MSDIFITEAELAQLSLRRDKLLYQSLPFFNTIEELLVSEDGFGLVTATPMQRAICRILQGLPLDELAENEAVVTALGGAEAAKWAGSYAPQEVLLLAGVRSAKSLLGAVLAVWASQTIDIGMVRKGEIPRFSVLSLSVDNARVVLGHLLGALSNKRLAHLKVSDEDANAWIDIIDESGSSLVGSLFVWHPNGHPIEIRVVAGRRAGGSLVSRWSAGCVLDEAARMIGQEEGVVNYDDARQAVISRLLPGAQLFSISSPWRSKGPVFDIVNSSFGSPSKSRVVIRARGHDMNPVWWTDERMAEIKKADPMVYKTDVLGEFADAEEAMFTQDVLEKITRGDGDYIRCQPGHDYVAAIDPATRGNAWTLIVCDKHEGKKRIVAYKEWIGNTLEPLSPRAVLAELADILGDYNLGWAYTDQWAADAIKEIALEYNVALVDVGWTEANKVRAYLSLATAAQDGTLELPNDKTLLKDLKMIKKMPTQRGLSIRLLRTTDGRHCDYAPAIARALYHWIDDEKKQNPVPGDSKYLDFIMEKIEKQEEEEFQQQNETWWQKPAWGLT